MQHTHLALDNHPPKVDDRKEAKHRVRHRLGCDADVRRAVGGRCRGHEHDDEVDWPEYSSDARETVEAIEYFVRRVRVYRCVIDYHRERSSVLSWQVVVAFPFHYHDVEDGKQHKQA